MTENDIELTRRKVLASTGAIGLASAGTALGTSAFFNDEESLEGNSMVAGTLDLQVDWEEHYYDSLDGGGQIGSVRTVDDASEIGENEVGFPDPANPVVAVDESDASAFMDVTTLESGGPTNDPPSGLIELNDVKPGDFGEVTFSYHLFGNPGYVAMCADDVSDDENGQPEPETHVDDSTGAGNGELGDAIRAALWYDPNCNNRFDEGDRARNLITEGSLNDVLGALGAGADGSCQVLDAVKASGTAANNSQSDQCHAPRGCKETLYLTDSGTSPTTLFEVTLDDASDEANLTDLGTLGSNFTQTDAMAATPDGSELYFYDKSTGNVGVYTVATGSFQDLGTVQGDGDPGGVVLAAFSPDGTLWVASQNDDHLCTVDTSTSPPSTTDQGGTGISLMGADMAFAADGTLYLWTADVSQEGLYKNPDPSSGTAMTPVDPANVPPSTSSEMTGLAIRDGGIGPIVGSDTQNDEVVIVDRATGEIVDGYPMNLADDPYTYDFGDMTVGEICPGNQCVALAWWLPRDVGNEVQSDRYGFDVSFRGEQCRHNETPFGTDEGT